MNDTLELDVIETATVNEDVVADTATDTEENIIEAEFTEITDQPTAEPESTETTKSATQAEPQHTPETAHELIKKRCGELLQELQDIFESSTHSDSIRDKSSKALDYETRKMNKAWSRFIEEKFDN